MRLKSTMKSEKFYYLADQNTGVEARLDTWDTPQLVRLDARDTEGRKGIPASETAMASPS